MQAKRSHHEMQKWCGWSDIATLSLVYAANGVRYLALEGDSDGKMTFYFGKKEEFEIPDYYKKIGTLEGVAWFWVFDDEQKRASSDFLPNLGEKGKCKKLTIYRAHNSHVIAWEEEEEN